MLIWSFYFFGLHWFAFSMFIFQFDISNYVPLGKYKINLAKWLFL